ncbi:hypothetical protein NQ317_019301 [Molorchus minor]|uniref:Helitron helicase-like domain-containing protein n=1 Tax=Molorchus minor TaxID=1323400 RepID=A0ABQ9J7C0_9CUCU|nr:hypothetical protein NQ317_019301 [Molorchus minor]
MLGNPDDRLRVGRAIVLPSGFQGGPCFMQRQYLDAMTVVARHGKPDLFVTFTCNPTWPEIAQNLEFRQKAEHRPDLVCSVFLDDVVIKQVYGVVLNYHYVIVFQKRGLPHAHMVVTFVDDERIRDVEHVDQIVSAVLPDQNEQPRLYELTVRPCRKPLAPCMHEGVCGKGYPKPFRNDTVLARGGNGRPEYKRPDDGRYGMHGDFRITNQRVVPYNGYALAKYQTHINFEVVGSLASIKYLYKYVSKGADYATIVEEPDAGADGGPPGGRVNVDEVQSYLDCRYVSSMEAAWRLLEFKMHDRSHSVMVLPVHLPGGNYVVVDDWEDEGRMEDRLEARSKLEAWFALNGDDADARRFKYAEIPEHFVWERREGGLLASACTDIEGARLRCGSIGPSG